MRRSSAAAAVEFQLHRGADETPLQKILQPSSKAAPRFTSGTASSHASKPLVRREKRPAAPPLSGTGVTLFFPWEST